MHSVGGGGWGAKVGKATFGKFGNVGISQEAVAADLSCTALKSESLKGNPELSAKPRWPPHSFRRYDGFCLSLALKSYECLSLAESNWNPADKGLWDSSVIQETT